MSLPRRVRPQGYPPRKRPDVSRRRRLCDAISHGRVIAQTDALSRTTVLVVRFLRTGGPAMLHLMNSPEDEMAQHDQAMDGMDHHGMRHDTA